MFSVLLYGKTLDLANYDSFGVNLLIILRGFATQIAITFSCFIITFNGVRLINFQIPYCCKAARSSLSQSLHMCCVFRSSPSSF